MVRIRGRIGDWPVDLTLELDAEEALKVSASERGCHQAQPR